jgi:hypothetical protein
MQALDREREHHEFSRKSGRLTPANFLAVPGGSYMRALLDYGYERGSWG